MKCNNYYSFFAFVNNKPIHISNIKDKNNIKCRHNHPLISYNNEYFLHKNDIDIDLNDNTTFWHKDWQSHFPYIEIIYEKCDNQIKTRRADIVLPKTIYNIEIQHSYIEKIEVKQRKKDYLLHHREIIWIIDGNSNNIIISNLSTNRYIIEFNDNNRWIYENFINYKYIFIDYNNYIYKLNPKNVKNYMIDVMRFCKKTFIKKLQDNNIDFLNENIVIKQSNLYIKQQGAGNGKTFGLIQNLKHIDFHYYDYFIIVSKQHSAKTIIYNEFINQIANGNLNELELLNPDKSHFDNNKYHIAFKNLITNKTSYIVISTIDSLMYKLGDKNNDDINKFEGIVKSLCDNCINHDFDNMTYIKYNNSNFNLNKKLCLFIDETQDLTKEYGEAIVRIIKDKYIDAYIVGDKLQSISYENNAFVYLDNLSNNNINVIKYDKVNIVRRFKSKQLIYIINQLIPFNKYSLPNISSYENNDNDMNDNDFEIIEGIIKNNNKNKNNDDVKFENINYKINKIMEYYKKEVEINNCKPEDFLIITPFTNNNDLISILETRIQLYWLNREKPTEYKNYAIFHKSENGTSINLTESNYATRMVSIHTSKGDGRNIVFIIGLTKSNLLKFSKNPDNLIYNSLIHVALTRMKKKLYFFMEDENDEIAIKLNNILNTYYIKTSNPKAIKPNIFKLTHNINISITTDLLLNLKNIITDKTIYNNYSNIININNKIIDINHHYIRYASMRILLILKIFKLDSNKHQIKAQILGLKDKNIIEVNNWFDYSSYIIKREKECKNNKSYMSYDICILEISKSNEYQKYYNIILQFIYNIKKKIKYFNECKYLCPYESIILNYILEFVRNGPYSNISIIELYNITNIYYKSYSKNIEGHKYCKCNELFNNNDVNNNDMIHKYLFNHYEYINNISDIYDNFLKKYPNVNWLLSHYINYFGRNKEFIFKKRFDFIGYDNDNVYIIYIKPQINELNYNEILISSIIDTFIINSYNNNYDESDNDDNDDNDKKTNDNNERFKNKKILTFIFSLNTNDYIILDWDNLIKDNNEGLKTLFIDNIINNYITNDDIFFYYKYHRNKYNNNDIIINTITNDISNNKKDYPQFPTYLTDFFNDLHRRIKWNNDIIENYDDIEYFNNKLKEYLKYKLNNYF